MKKLIEPGPGFKAGWHGMRLNVANITASVTAAIFTLAGAIILFANAASQANLSPQQASSWIMVGFSLEGISTFIMCLYYKQPTIIAPSLAALLVMPPMFHVFTVQEIVAGYLIAAVLLFVIGARGIVGWIGRYLPLPIIMGMLAGVFMSYGLNLVEAVRVQPLVAGLTIASFLLTPLISRKIPAQATALVVAIVLTFLFLPFKAETGNISYQLMAPVFIWPEFNIRIIPAVSIPLVLMGLADILKGYGVLRVNAYEPPLNTLTAWAGVVSFIGAFSLCHIISLAGPVTAMIGGSSAGAKEHRYAGGVLLSIALVIIGITGGLILPFIMALPAAVSSVIAGLAMLGLFTSSLEMAFGTKRFQMGAFTALIVGMSNVTLGGIGAPVWAILFGITVSAFLERGDFNIGRQNVSE